MAANQREVDFLIVGAGIAGTTLGLELEKLGKSVVLFDIQNENSSSRVAAGLISPMVPRNVRKTWLSDQIFPHVYKYYREFEIKWNSQFIHEIPMHQIHKNLRQVHNWTIRAGEPGFESYLNIHAPELPSIMKPLNFDSIEVRQTGRLEVSKFINEAKKHFISQGIPFLVESFNYNELHLNNNYWYYSNFKCKQVVFCEGIGVLQNPFFNKLPFKPSGGDILTVELKEIPQTHILKKKEWLLPIGDSKWLAGSTYHQNSTSTEIDPNDANILLDEFESWVGIRPKILDHKRGVRPTVAERRPFLGEHPTEKNLFLYNGLGSKGSSLCSVLSPMLARHLVLQEPLLKEVNLSDQFDSDLNPKTP